MLLRPGQTSQLSMMQQDHTLSIAVDVSEETTWWIDLNDTTIHNMIMHLLRIFVEHRLYPITF
jgi:hypothetical protein